MNPADAFRKTQRAKEIARNKKERKFQRDAHSMKDNPEAIKEELKSVLDMEETQEGRVNQTIRLKKRALQGAYDTALKKRKVSPQLINIIQLFLQSHIFLSQSLTGLNAVR